MTDGKTELVLLVRSPDESRVCCYWRDATIVDARSTLGAQPQRRTGQPSAPAFSPSAVQSGGGRRVRVGSAVSQQDNSN
jgi:hypothetical protein